MKSAQRGGGYDRIMRLLAEAVGQPTAHAAIVAASAACGVQVDGIDEQQVQPILRKIAEAPGLIGVTAQLAAARLRLESMQIRLRRSGEK